MKRVPKRTEPARPSLTYFLHPDHERSAKPHNNHPLSVIGWKWTACLWGGQLADRVGRSDECDHLCFSLELLIQPLTLTLSETYSLNVRAWWIYSKRGCFDDILYCLTDHKRTSVECCLLIPVDRLIMGNALLNISGPIRTLLWLSEHGAIVQSLSGNR